MSDIQLEVQDGIAIATLDRPERLNAFRHETYRELLAIAARLSVERGWRALVVTGAGRAFSAGQDLDDVPSAGADPLVLRSLIGELQDITRCFAGASKPTVAAINGAAVGFGLEFTLALDLRIASEDAYFMLPELAHGLFHTNGTYHYLARLVGTGLATDMTLTGLRLDATRALHAGIVTRLVGTDELLPRAVEAAALLARIEPHVLALVRKGIRELHALDLEAALQFEASSCLTLLTPG